MQRQVFSHLLTCLPVPMPAPALDTVSTTRTAKLSNKPFRNCQQSYHTGIKGLAHKCQEEKAQLKAGVRQVAAVAGATLVGRSTLPGTRDEHLQVCFLALTHSLMPEKVPNRGTKQNRFPGNRTQFRAQKRLADNCAFLCARKRELTPNRRQAAAR